MWKMPPRFHADWSRFASAAGGNITVIFSLSACVLLGIAGAAMDYARLIEQRTVFAAAADAAVLAAISSAREAERADLTGIQSRAETAAKRAWDLNIATSSLDGPTHPVITVKKIGSAWQATVTYNQDSPTTFVSLLGVKTMKIGGSSTASTVVEKSPNYWDFHIVIDTSSSMGIGATPADMAAMEADPQIGCAFACHYGNYAAGETDTVKIAKTAGYKLRVDIVDEAVDGMIDVLKTAGTNNNMRSELWGMNDTVAPLVDLTDKLDDVKTHDIQLYATPVSVGNTNYEASFAKLETEVGHSGDGKSSLAPKKAVFIVTDGIHDTGIHTSNVSYVWWADHQMGTIDPAFCQTMKDNGVLVGVLYIDYIAPAGHVDLMNNVTPSVLPALQACATDGLFFNATTPQAIKKSLQDMLKAALGLGAVRLTN